MFILVIYMFSLAMTDMFFPSFFWLFCSLSNIALVVYFISNFIYNHIFKSPFYFNLHNYIHNELFIFSHFAQKTENYRRIFALRVVAHPLLYSPPG